MIENNISEEYFEGTFVTSVSAIRRKLQHTKAFVFDWDGVFNDGRKNIEGHSSFSETDSMGLNMMRFSYYLKHQQLPLSIILTGESNKLAISFAQRENFHSVYYKTPNKKKALEHLCEAYNISPTEVLFVFDDVLDFSVAELAGIRCMVTHSANALLKKFATEKELVDYITKHNGNDNAVREISELVMTLTNNFDLTIENRMYYSELYHEYIQLRKSVSTRSFITKAQQVIEDINL
jgi:3-deoxy-D-manno-octulosonate 8-phosphate phosphatase (KDO 8-P phosphatase)